MWHQLDPASADPTEVLLAKWVNNPKRCVDPYWLLAAALDYSGFADKNPLKKLPVMVEPSGAAQKFELHWYLRADLGRLISRVPGSIRRFQLDAPRTQGLDDFTTLSVPLPMLEGPVRIAAVIDDGLPFAHPNLLDIDPDGSIRSPRFVSLWDQGDANRPQPPWTKPPGLHFGALLSKADIKNLVGPHRSTLDEAAVYARAQYKYRVIGNPHGAGVTQLLAGREVALADGSRQDFPQRPPVLPVIGVQLPEAAIGDTAGAWLGFYALAALRHIVRESINVANGQPWHTVVNLSYGSMAGPHNGTSMLERAMAALVDGIPESSAKLDIVLAAGNSRGRQIHAQRTVATGTAAVFRFLTPPDNPRESYVELWIPAKDDKGIDCDPHMLRFTVTSPSNQTATLAVGEAAVLGSIATRKWYAGAVFAHQVAQGTDGTMVLLLVRPTRTAGQPDRAPSGIWSVEVESTSAQSVTIHAWVERNDLVGRTRRAQQAHFVADPTDPDHVNDDRTLSNVANGPHVTVVGAVRASDSVITAYSGRGYIECDKDIRPKWLAAGDANAAVRGVLVRGFLGGASTRMSGTSVAAPWVGRWLLSKEPGYAIGPTYDAADQTGPPFNRTILSR